MTRYSTESPCTAQQAAALDFQPWSGKPEDLITDGGRGAMESNRLTILFATYLMFKTKPELVDWIDEHLEEADTLMRGIWAAQSSLKAALDLLDGAEARMICAGSVLELEDEPDPKTPERAHPWQQHIPLAEAA